MLETYISKDIPMPDDKGRSNLEKDDVKEPSSERLPDLPQEIVGDMEPKWYDTYRFLNRNGVRKGDLLALFSRIIEAGNSYIQEAERWFEQNIDQYDILRDIGKGGFIARIRV